MTDTTHPRRSRAAVTAVVLIAAAVAAAAVLAIALHGSPDELSWRLRSARVVDPQHVEISFDVTKAPLAEAACTVRARDGGSRPVGTELVTIGPRRDDRRTTLVTHTLATSAPAARGELVGCHITRTR